jgi:phosphatidylinositol glycan class B
LLLNAIIVAAPTDLAVFYISSYIFKEGVVQSNNNTLLKAEHWALLASITNWFNGYALIRTYSNSVETVILVLGISLLCPELFGEVYRKQDFKIRMGTRIAFLLGGVGVVIRFTALAAWIPIGMMVCFRRHFFTAKVYHFCNACFYGAAGVLLGCVVDRYFYGFWAIPFLGSFHFNVLLGK